MGLVGVRLAKHLGAGRIIATTRAGRGHDLLVSLGVDRVVQPRAGSFAAAVLEAAGEGGVDVILDHVGGPYLEDNLHVAAVQARLVGIGRLGGAVGRLDMEALAVKRVQLTGVTFRTRTIHEKLEVVRALRADLDLDQAATPLRPVVDTIAPWHRIEQLQARMAAGRHLGKLVLEVPTTTA